MYKSTYLFAAMLNGRLIMFKRNDFSSEEGASNAIMLIFVCENCSVVCVVPPFLFLCDLCQKDNESL